MSTAAHVVIGKVGKPYGIKGWVKIISFTRPPENILTYSPWLLLKANSTEPVELLDGRKQGNAIVAHLNGLENPEEAALLTNTEIAVSRTQLPALPNDEYYWSDLQDLKVVTLEGTELGQVAYLFSSASNDVLVVKGDKERLLPFIGTVIKKVDMANGVITVEWDPEF